jgi:CDGSH-type Zn-finger protein
MARLVKRVRNTPYEVSVGTQTKFICGCGLSGTLPYCDGSHTITNAEPAETLSWYDLAKQRHPVEDTFPGIRSEAPIVRDENQIAVPL